MVRREKRAKQAQRLCEPERDTEKPAGPRNGPSSWLPSVQGSGPVCARLENPFVRWPRQDSKEPRGTQESTEVFSTDNRAVHHMKHTQFIESESSNLKGT